MKAVVERIIQWLCLRIQYSEKSNECSTPRIDSTEEIKFWQKCVRTDELMPLAFWKYFQKDDLSAFV